MQALTAGSRAAWASTTMSPSPTTRMKYSPSWALDQLRDNGEVFGRVTGGRRLLERGFRVLEAGEVDLHELGELERVAHVFQGVLDRKRFLGELVRQHGLHPVMAQREAVGGALGQRLERFRRIEAELPDHGERFGHRQH